MYDKVAILPFFSRYNGKDKVDDEVTRKEIDELVDHYARELITKISYHGFELNDAFFRDYGLAHEALKSTLLRNVGKYHPLQEYVDTIEEMKQSEMSEPTE